MLRNTQIKSKGIWRWEETIRDLDFTGGSAEPCLEASQRYWALTPVIWSWHCLQKGKSGQCLGKKLGLHLQFPFNSHSFLVTYPTFLSTFKETRLPHNLCEGDIISSGCQSGTYIDSTALTAPVNQMWACHWKGLVSWCHGPVAKLPSAGRKATSHLHGELLTRHFCLAKNCFILSFDSILAELFSLFWSHGWCRQSSHVKRFLNRAMLNGHKVKNTKHRTNITEI